MEIWSTIHAERKALADDLGELRGDQWSTQSLCDNWSVREVLAHMTATAKITPPLFFTKMLTSGFSFPRLQAKNIATEKGDSPADGLSRFASVLDSVKHPPGPNDSWLGETLIHSEDIRRPLGIQHQYPVEAAMQVANFYKGSNLIIGAKRRIEGLTLRATDADWTHGTGPEVSGPIMTLVMAMTGRKPVLDELSGEGVTTLRSRS